MSSFKDVVGHKNIIQYIENAVKTDKVSHAYILNGEKGSGKRLLANLFAMSLQCQNRDEDGDACGKCQSCKQAASNNQPDIIRVTHEKPNTISIDDIREQINNDIVIKPYSSKYKIYIVPDADMMSVQAQNALLKTIEEPPAYAVVMLLADNPDALLPTISSRCVQLNLKPVGDQLVKDYLMNEMHVPDYQAEVDASLAQGNIGKAERIARSPEYEETLESALRMAKYADSMPLYEIVETIKKLTAEKDNIDDYFDIFSLWFRDVLLFKATKEVDSLVFKQELNGIRERANKSSYEGLEKIIEAIQKARARLNANVNFDLTMELMFLTMKEN
mgnify:CR=1 FL=1